MFSHVCLTYHVWGGSDFFCPPVSTLGRIRKQLSKLGGLGSKVVQCLNVLTLDHLPMTYCMPDFCHPMFRDPCFDCSSMLKLKSHHSEAFALATMLIVPRLRCLPNSSLIAQKPNRSMAIFAWNMTAISIAFPRPSVQPEVYHPDDSRGQGLTRCWHVPGLCQFTHRI